MGRPLTAAGAHAGLQEAEHFCSTFFLADTTDDTEFRTCGSFSVSRPPSSVGDLKVAKTGQHTTSEGNGARGRSGPVDNLL